MMRSLLVVTLLASPSAAFAQDVTWTDVRKLGVEGQGWQDTKSPFDRFPSKAEGKVPAPVWNLSRHSSGLATRFVTDAKSIQVKWTLTNDKLAMPHMPATGVSGVDLYVRKSSAERWNWLKVGIPVAKDSVQSFDLPAGKNECLVYMPLYNGVSAVEIGVPKGSTIAKSDAYPKGHEKPILFYGTSITQGGCASRPGMVHTAIVGRKLDYPVINMGFSGNGKMDDSVVSLLAELDPAVYVIDCLPNMNAGLIGERTVPLVQALRKARPDTPILLVEDRTYANAPVNEKLRAVNAGNRAALKKEFAKLQEMKVPGVHYLSGDKLIGDDGEGTVDGSHPTDLGFMRQADVFVEALRPILK